MSDYFVGADAELIGVFGEVVQGFPKPIFSPGSSEEQELDGIMEQSARPEERTPGSVARLFISPPDTFTLPERMSLVEVRGDTFAVTDIRSDDVGAYWLTLRKK